MKLTSNEQRKRRKLRIRKKIYGTAERPRMVVFRSNKHIYAQLVNDESGQTVAASSTLTLGKSGEVKGLTLENAAQVGKDVAEKAKAMNIETIVFDRSGYKYHGRIKALADGAREAGLKF